MKNYIISLLLWLSFSIGVTISLWCLTISKILAGVSLCCTLLISILVWKIVNKIDELIQSRFVRNRAKLIKKALKIAENNKYYNMTNRTEAKVYCIITILKKLSNYEKFFTNTTITPYIDNLRNSYYKHNELYLLLEKYQNIYGNDSQKVKELTQDIWDYDHFNNIVEYLSLFPEQIDVNVDIYKR